LKAQVLTAHGDVAGFELRELPIPDLRPGHVLVRIAATSVNPVDCKLRRHGSEAAPLLPAVLGADFSGRVEAVADDVDRFVVGDPVFGCGGGVRGLPGGALAEYLLVDSRLAARKPERLNHRESAALPLVAITALEGLDRACVTAGDHVLVLGGTGGVGHVVTQLARALGARVTATASTPERARLVLDFGAQTVADHVRETPAEIAARVTGGRGFDVVFDASGGTDPNRSVQAARRNGHVVMIAGKGAHDLASLYARGQSLHCVMALIPMLYGESRAAHGALLERIAGFADRGELRPLLDDHAYTLADAPAAHRQVEEGRALGKVVVTVAEF
jgi:NADPH2:quinone reductase